MKIGFISDLHIDRSPKHSERDYEIALSKQIKNQRIDLLIIGGDISNHYVKSYEFIKKMKSITGIEILFIPGNHDYWNSNEETTWGVHQYFVDKPECLIDKPYIINKDWAIVGNPGWYDYSFANSKFDKERLAKRQYKGATWQDKVHIDWGMSDIEVSKKAAENTKKDLETVKDKNIILVTHVVTESSFKVPMPHRIFDYFNAFIGTSHFDDLYKTYPIRYSVMGHVHFRTQLYKNDTQFLCVSLGYYREWRTKDINQEMQHALKVIAI